MQWGTELWDKYGELCVHTNLGVDFLDNSVAAFIKERGKIEAEYAKSLRALVKKFTPRDVTAKASSSSSSSAPASSSSSTPASATSTLPATSLALIHSSSLEEQFSHMIAYKQMLEEVGFLAGQHEVLAETFTKEIYKKVHEEAKKLKERRRRSMKDYEKLNEELKKAFKHLDSSREKFRKAFDEHDKATGAFEKANSDNSVSRTELDKLRQQAATKSSHSDSLKCQYASQLVKTNEFQSRYYYESLPSILNQLQDVDRCRITSMKEGIIACVSKEFQVAPIINNCRNAIKTAMESINADEDTEIVIDRFKSGDVPPGDFNFEDMRDPQAMLRPDNLADNRPTNLNLYPKKRELERQISCAQKELSKCQKELKSFQKMEATYNSNPKFGNSKQLLAEMEQVTYKMAELDKLLNDLRAEHQSVEQKLSSLKNNRSPNMSFRMHNDTLRRGSSQCSSSSSNSSTGGGGGGGGGGTGGGGIGGPGINISNQFNSTGTYHEIQSQEQVPGDQHLETWAYEEEDEEEDDDHEMPPPPDDLNSQLAFRTPIPSPSVTSSSSYSGSSSLSVRRCYAMYDYTDTASMQDCNIPIAEGEELLVVEDDCDGWTRVRRVHLVPDQPSEGYVPSSYIKFL